jgi:D-alanyl-D-alanine carboxypeptidase
MKMPGLSNVGFYAALAALVLIIILMSFQLKRSGTRRDAKTVATFSSDIKDEGAEVSATSDDSTVDDASTVDAADDSAKDAEFAPAALENARLKTEMEWTFGGKAQHGWYLYASLIKELLGTDKQEESRGFALALSRWQKANGLAPRGVLDTETMLRIISVWQERRIKDKTVPPADKLFTAPIADFYDPTREEALRKVEPQTYAAYKRMVAAAARSLKLERDRDGGLAPGEQYLKIVSAFRSPEYQEKLRQKSPNSGPAGLAKVSPHFTGRALDLYVGGDPVSTEDGNRALQVNTKVYKWLVKNASKFGFYPYFYEPWHWEYVGQ